MLRWLGQTITVSALSVRTIPQRLSSSAVAVIGIAGVVIVFVAVLSIGAGFRAAMADAGSPSRAMSCATAPIRRWRAALPAIKPTS
jgi:putative ABC transport system permease protein